MAPDQAVWLDRLDAELGNLGHRHLANILRKLGLSKRAAAAVWGVRSGLL